MQDGVDAVLAFAPIRLRRRAVEVSGVHLVTHGRDSPKDGDTGLWQGV